MVVQLVMHFVKLQSCILVKSS